MTKPISARIKAAVLDQMNMEKCNGIKTNAAINDGLQMFLELLDIAREHKQEGLIIFPRLDLARFAKKWYIRLTDLYIQ